SRAAPRPLLPSPTRRSSDLHRSPAAPTLPEPAWAEAGSTGSAMTALDDWFVACVQANPGLRVRVGNPDELASNKMGRTLALLRQDRKSTRLNSSHVKISYAV